MRVYYRREECRKKKGTANEVNNLQYEFDFSNV